MRNERTSKTVASKAARILRSRKAGKAAKSVAASALTQRERGADQLGRLRTAAAAYYAALDQWNAAIEAIAPAPKAKAKRARRKR